MLFDHDVVKSGARPTIKSGCNHLAYEVNNGQMITAQSVTMRVSSGKHSAYHRKHRTTRKHTQETSASTITTRAWCISTETKKRYFIHYHYMD